MRASRIAECLPCASRTLRSHRVRGASRSPLAHPTDPSCAAPGHPWNTARCSLAMAREQLARGLRSETRRVDEYRNKAVNILDTRGGAAMSRTIQPVLLSLTIAAALAGCNKQEATAPAA